MRGLPAAAGFFGACGVLSPFARWGVLRWTFPRWPRLFAAGLLVTGLLAAGRRGLVAAALPAGPVLRPTGGPAASRGRSVPAARGLVAALVACGTS